MHSKSRETSVVAQGPSSCQEKAFTDHYQVLRAIGHGAFGQVLLARHLLTGAEVAVKVLERIMWKSLVCSEKRALKTLNHPNVIQLFEVIENNQNIYLVMEHAGRGALADLIPDGSMQEEEEARRLFRQVVGAVCYCHKMLVVHGDLKPENIVLDARGNIRLIDFGLSTILKPGQQQSESWGPLEGPPGDSWDLGVLLYFMLTGNRPLWISSSELEFPQHVSAEAQELVKKILAEEPERRLSVEEIFQDPWLNQGEENFSSQDVPLPNLSDPTVLTILFDLGFDLYSTWVSLSKRKFDHAMAAYLLIQQQMNQGTGCMKPVSQRVAPRLYFKDASVFPALPKRWASEPVLHTFSMSWEHQPPEEAKEAGQKSMRSCSVPDISLCFLHEKNPPPSLASQTDSVCNTTTPPDSVWDTTTPPDSVWDTTTQPDSVCDTTTQPDSVWDTTTQPDSVCDTTTQPDSVCDTTTQPDSVSDTTTQPDSVCDTTTQPDSVSDTPRPCISADSYISQDASSEAPPHGHRKGWKQVRQRIAACFRRLCLCIPSRVSEDVAETQGDEKPAKFRNRVLPT